MKPLTFAAAVVATIALAYMAAVPEASHGGAVHCAIVRAHHAQCKECRE